MTTPHRSEIFSFAHDVVEGRRCARSDLRNGAGITAYDDQLPDFSPEGTRRHVEATRAALRELSTLTANDDIDRLAVSVMEERLSTRLTLLESGEAERVFSVIWSPLSDIRQVFELMGSDSDEERSVIARRLDQIPVVARRLAPNHRGAGAAPRASRLVGTSLGLPNRPPRTRRGASHVSPSEWHQDSPRTATSPERHAEPTVRAESSHGG